MRWGEATFEIDSSNLLEYFCNCFSDFVFTATPNKTLEFSNLFVLLGLNHVYLTKDFGLDYQGVWFKNLGY